ncbi:caspase family protein [Streptomyces sp. CA-256286]|uniref:caspase family protein n=1 Tax=Streptomyces sp. CA-256286 TaxID=2801033 RepID=UPI00241872A4|nr:caspase family protein [Streptomyces sp. CA-256286]
MRKALIVGIDYYEKISSLNGAVNDAHSVKTTLERNADGNSQFRATEPHDEHRPGIGRHSRRTARSDRAALPG